MLLTQKKEKFFFPIQSYKVWMEKWWRNRFPSAYERFLGIGSENTGFQSCNIHQSIPTCFKKKTQSKIIQRFCFNMHSSNVQRLQTEYSNLMEDILHVFGIDVNCCNWILFDFMVCFFFLFRLPNIILTEYCIIIKKNQMHKICFSKFSTTTTKTLASNCI